MKKSVLLFILVAAFFYCKDSAAQYSIPAWNVNVHGRATFEESGPADGKRTVHVKESCTGGASIQEEDSDVPVTIVYIYSLDHTTILGPYYLECGETLSVEIDDREWGVFVQSDTEVFIDVWFSQLEKCGG